MSKVAAIVAGALAYVGLYFLALLVCVRLGLGEVWLYVIPALAGAVAAAIVANGAGGSLGAALATLIGAGVVFLLGMTDWLGAVSIAIAAGGGLVGAIFLGVTPLARWEPLRSFLLATTVTVGFAFVLLLAFAENPHLPTLLLVGIVFGMGTGGFLAQWLATKRRILACGTGYFGLAAWLLLTGVDVGEIYLMLAVLAPAGPVGAWLAWTIRRGGGATETVAL